MIGTFLASEARIFSRLLSTYDVDAAQLYREEGLDSSLMNRPRARYPFDRVAAAWGRAARLTDKPHIGLEVAEHYRPTDFHGLAVAFLASYNLRTALERFARYHGCVNTAFAMRLEYTPASIDLVCPTIDVDEDAKRVIQDARAAVLIDLCRTGSDGNLDPLRVVFAYPDPGDSSEHSALFRCPVEFGADEWRLSFRTSDLDRPFLADNRELARASDAVLDAMCKGLRKEDLVSRVKLAMVEELPSGTPSEEAVAKTVSMSTRSLQRRLAEEGTSFTNLLAVVRKELAEQYVLDRQLPVTEISYLLGFSDVSSFSRAFKRWTGHSPATGRQQAA
ncbi:MAG: AraC family transcriptional regulator [Candidatus Binatia bacterium]